MHRFSLLAAILALAAAAGCDNTQLKALQGENLDLKNQLAQREGDIARLESELQGVDSRISALETELQGRQAQLDAANRKIQELLEQPMAFQLDPAVRAQLRDIAARFPQQLEFDEAANTVRVKEAINFPAGRSNITDRARDALGAIARVLQDIDGVRFRVGGHTDSDPIRASAHINKDNMDLSLKRAHAVWDVLKDAGLAEEKMYCAGFGPTRPLAPNTTNENKQKNRRVEILVLPAD